MDAITGRRGRYAPAGGCPAGALGFVLCRIYWIASDGAVHQYHVDTKRSTPVGFVDVESIKYWDRPALSVASDGHWIVYAVREGAQSDIMLVENFR